MTGADLAADLERIGTFLAGDKTLDQRVWSKEACAVQPRTITGLDQVRAELDAFDARDGWLTLQSAVVFREGGDWEPLRNGPCPNLATMPILAGELSSADGGRSLDVRHLAGDRWLFTYAMVGDDALPRLCRRQTHLSVRRGKQLVYKVYWDLVEGGGLTSYAPVARRFVGFEDAENWPS